jgi:iron complex outermembrane receptor protein
MSLFAAANAAPATAQTALPTIVVETPSPVVRQRPRPAPQPGPSSTAATPAEAIEPLTSFDDAVEGPFVFVDGTFVPVTVTTERDVLATSAPNLTASIDQRPGISSSTFAAGSNRPVIRGLDNYRVRIQENGIGSHDVSAISEDHAVPIDPNAAEKIEVVRGPSTLRYGSQAIGGVVAVENNRIPTFVPRHGVMGAIKGGINSVDSGKDGAFSITAGSKTGFVIHADGSRRRTDDYDTPKGKEFNTFVETDSASLGGSYVWNSGYFGVSVTRFESFYGIPGRGEEFLEHRPRIDMRQDKVVSRGEWRVRTAGIDTIRMWLGATDYAHNEIIVDHDTERDVVGTRFTNKQYEGRLEVQHLPYMTAFGQMTGAIGVQAGQRKVRGFTVAEDGDSLLDPAKTNYVAAFIFEELQLTRKLRLQAAARIEQNGVDGNGVLFNETDPLTSGAFAGKRTFTPLSGSVGVLYDLPGGVVMSLTGKYVERAPDAAELYSKGVHEATETFEIGNPFLEKEKAQTIEFGFRKAKGPFRFDATAYYSRFNGFIYKQLDPDRCGEDLASCADPAEDELGLVLFRQRDAIFYGAEVMAQYDVGRFWNGVWGLYGQYDFVRAEFADGENVPRIPPHRLGGGIYYKDGALYARAGVLQAFEQDKIGFEEIATPGYTLVSAELSYTTAITERMLGYGPGSTFTIGVKGDNLANEQILNHVSFKRRDEILLPGASVRVFGKIQWQ